MVPGGSSLDDYSECPPTVPPPIPRAVANPNYEHYHIPHYNVNTTTTTGIPPQRPITLDIHKNIGADRSPTPAESGISTGGSSSLISRTSPISFPHSTDAGISLIDAPIEGQQFDKTPPLLTLFSVTNSSSKYRRPGPPVHDESQDFVHSLSPVQSSP